MSFLYQQTLSDMACDTRSWSEYGLAILLGLFICTAMLVPYLRSSPSPWRRTVFGWCGGLCVLFPPLFAIVPALSEKTTSVFLEGSDLVRDGCRGSQRLIERHPLADITTSYVHSVSRGIESDSLRIHWSGQTRKFGLDLFQNDPLLGNLAAFAPEAMAETAAALRYRDIALPSDLERLRLEPPR
ncbi:hypothetical protein [Rhizobium sp. R693]|uniref:hypothetical protein n=1 Tax=Rhizobium sp. R693 TaxID=1764276 RepID=UPI001131DE35|nr:hypothetical protein [Rhizobium sp. R693]